MKPSTFTKIPARCAVKASTLSSKILSRFSEEQLRIALLLSGVLLGILITLAWVNNGTSEQSPTETTASQSSNFPTKEEIVNAQADDTSTAIDESNTVSNNAATLPAVKEEIKLNYIYHTIKSGESLGSIMDKHEFSPIYPHNIVRAENGKLFKNIRIGKELKIGVDPTSSSLKEVSYPLSPLKVLVATIENIQGNTSVEVIDVPHDTVQTTAAGVINGSLFGAALEAGVDQNMIMELAEAFGWDIDFNRDIQKDDTFKFVYEKHVRNGELLKNGNILAAEFINHGKKFTAIRYEDSKGNASFYAPDGSSMKGTFLKSPMKFSRISSTFQKRRYHPILKKWRAHKGVDYAAGRGTPIRSVADGKIILRGKKGGYGRTVVISHGGKYTTLYAHMSRYQKKQRTGSRVKQGQIIGYVGASGLATGPHLHYEFRVNGVHRNPLTYKTPKATSLKSADLANFSAIAEQRLALLDTLSTQ